MLLTLQYRKLYPLPKPCRQHQPIRDAETADAPRCSCSTVHCLQDEHQLSHQPNGIRALCRLVTGDQNPTAKIPLSSITQSNADKEENWTVTVQVFTPEHSWLHRCRVKSAMACYLVSTLLCCCRCDVADANQTSKAAQKG